MSELLPKRERKFGGVVYYRHSFSANKMDAGKNAKLMRKEGNLVRIVKGMDKITGKKGYWLYIRISEKYKKKYR